MRGNLDDNKTVAVSGVRFDESHPVDVDRLTPTTSSRIGWVPVYILSTLPITVKTFHAAGALDADFTEVGLSLQSEKCSKRPEALCKNLEK